MCVRRYGMTKPIKNNKTERININVTSEQKEWFFRTATKEGLSVTDFILWKCADTEKPSVKHDINTEGKALLEFQIRTLTEQLERERKTLEKVEEKLEHSEKERQDLQNNYNGVVNALALNRLPFWKKFGKNLELPNKTK